MVNCCFMPPKGFPPLETKPPPSGKSHESLFNGHDGNFTRVLAGEKQRNDFACLEGIIKLNLPLHNGK
ncbi:hypothetical protein C4565_09430 [Candidatus Parcubacteria bacterium]|nr:MAG: hypothetical protein C4565_09430 [Candidatus Parcubacteria bacterium]